MAGHDVAAWQAVLRYEARPDGWQARWPLTVDGQFGPLTGSATKTYQERRTLSVSGVVDAETRALIDPTLFASPAPDLGAVLPPIAFLQARDYGWAQRTTMLLIALVSAFVLRYGPRPRYLGLGILMGVVIDRMQFDRHRSEVLSRYEEALRQWHAYQMTLEKQVHDH